ncbi:hypothetical protein [Pseudactinotalea sp.]|uniref:hypothetical protein n=1 Tax=Pseudactinotalea sp. TaxID=1926260 RepID=UPI003B3BC2BD
MRQASGPSALGRSPLVIGAMVLAVLAVVVIVSDRTGGEAGAAYGADNGADCVAVHPDGLREADWAFDGVVTGTGPSVSDRAGAVLGYTGVTFEVREWFAGGSGAEVTVDLSSRPSIGTRLLVAGAARWGGQPLDAPVSWQGCGFVRYFDPDLADAWRTTFP